MRALIFAVFLTVATSIVGLLHYYVWMRLVRDPGWPLIWQRLGTVGLVAAAVSLPLGMVLVRFGPDWLGRIMAWPLFVWMGAVFLFFCFFAVSDGVRVGLQLALGAGFDPERRALFARVVSGAGFLTVGGATIFGILRATQRLSVRRIEIAIDRLPATLDGLSIVQLTDIHVGPTIGKRFISEMVEKTNALAPDIVAITGDLVDGSVKDLAADVAPIAGLRARHGVYFVTGNHEYYSGVDDWVAHLPSLGVRVLQNERVDIAGALDLAGIPDYNATEFGGAHRPDLARALEGRDPARPLVLMAHQPRHVWQAAEHKVDLQLSGHTHAGQIWPFTYLVRLQQPFIVGTHLIEQTQLYVSPGTGYWGPPMRIGTTAEITQIILKRKS